MDSFLHNHEHNHKNNMNILFICWENGVLQVHDGKVYRRRGATEGGRVARGGRGGCRGGGRGGGGTGVVIRG
jgi:hypothetical protein